MGLHHHLRLHCNWIRFFMRFTTQKAKSLGACCVRKNKHDRRVWDYQTYTTEAGFAFHRSGKGRLSEVFPWRQQKWWHIDSVAAVCSRPLWREEVVRTGGTGVVMLKVSLERKPECESQRPSTGSQDVNTPVWTVHSCQVVSRIWSPCRLSNVLFTYLTVLHFVSHTMFFPSNWRYYIYCFVNKVRQSHN